MAEQGKVKVLISLDADAAALLPELAGGQRKQGEYLSNLIRREAAARDETPWAQDLAEMRKQLAGVLARLARLEDGTP